MALLSSPENVESQVGIPTEEEVVERARAQYQQFQIAQLREANTKLQSQLEDAQKRLTKQQQEYESERRDLKLLSSLTKVHSCLHSCLDITPLLWTSKTRNSN